MRVTVEGREHLPVDIREYAEEKSQRLSRHANLDDVSFLIDRDHKRVRVTAELIVHLQHVRMASSAEGATFHEAIDRVIDIADEQVRRRKEKVTQHT